MASLTDLEKSRPLEPTTVELRRLRSEQLVHVLVTSDTKPSEFRYQKLQSEENIRLLKYSYTGTSQEISYEIVEKRLAEISGQFVAMSYRWGILRPDRPLPLANPTSYVLVTRIVKTMLEHIVGDLDVLYIWIDAVCIDQNNTLEKNSQVSMMGKIFSSARSVRVWLGRSTREMDESFLWFWLKLLLRPNLQKSVTEPRSFQEADEYLKLILEPEWFERVWVVQEACLANQLFFHYGKIIISMNRLHEVLIQRLKYPHTAALVDRRQEGPHDFLLTSFSVLQEFHTIRSFIKDHSREGLRSLSELYASFASSKATDPRDHVYALLGLLHPASLGGIQPDYHASVSSTYIDATFRIIDAQGELSILGFAGLAQRTSGSRSMREIPTWVPDFSESPTADVWARLKVFEASSVRTMEPITFSLIQASSWDLIINPNLLYPKASIVASSGSTKTFGCISLTGVVFDTVAGIGSWPKKLDYDTRESYPHASPMRMNEKKNMYETLRETYKKAEDLGTYSPKETASAICWKTLIANLNGVDMPRKSMFEDAQAFVANLMVLLRLTAFEQRQEQIVMGPSSLWPRENQIKEYSQRSRAGYQNKYAGCFARSGAGHYRRMFWTDHGRLGLAADGVRAGDFLCIFAGARVPFLIRGPVAWRFGHVDKHHFYHLVCEAYVHGVMEGELEQSSNLVYENIYII